MQEKKIFATDRRKYVVLVIYDITDTKKRLKMVKCLEKYAIRVQWSCFEGLLTPDQCRKLESEACGIIDEKTDSLRVYVMHDAARVKAWGTGNLKTENLVDDVIVF